MSKKVYVIDGNEFSNLEEFAYHFSVVLLNDYEWRGNLDALNDILGGGFGTPDEGFILEWHNADKSKQDLGYAETIKRLEKILKTCHPTNIRGVQARIEAAKLEMGNTLFDELVEIIRIHGAGGRESSDGVELVLA